MELRVTEEKRTRPPAGTGRAANHGERTGRDKSIGSDACYEIKYEKKDLKRQ